MFDLTDSEKPILQPELSQWGCVPWQPVAAGLQLLRQSARRSLVQTARQFTAALPGHSETSADWLIGDPDTQPLVLTGHQPVVFHSGLAFKYQVTEQFVRGAGAIGVAVQIDTDEGDAGQFAVPAGVTEPAVAAGGLWHVLTQRRITWTAQTDGGTAASLLGSGQLCSVSERQRLSQQVRRWLSSAGCAGAAESFGRAAGWYEELPESGVSVSQANTVVRRRGGIGARLLELPLSWICGLPEVLRFLCGVLQRAKDFFGAYNEVLQRFRQQQGIRNAVNPFPDLRFVAGADGERWELPLWLVDLPRGERRVVWLWRRAGQRWLGTESGGELRGESELWPGLEGEAVLSLRLRGLQLVPRGGLISALLRLLFADFFVHGLGGGKYEPAVDELIRSWWGEDPPGFAVASASRYLFSEQRAELFRLREFAGRQRELQYNPDRFLGQAIFSEQAEQRLRGLLGEREVLVSELQRRRAAGEGAQEIGTRLQRLTEQLRATAGADLAPRVQVLQQLSDETCQQLENRQWPWYCFLPAVEPPVTRWTTDR